MTATGKTAARKKTREGRANGRNRAVLKNLASQQVRTGQTVPWPHPLLAARNLQLAAAGTMPLYDYIALDSGYAAELAGSINDRDADRTMRLVHRILPFAGVSSGAGFSVMYKMGGTNLEIGTYRPGKKVSASGLQQVAETVLPLMRTIAASIPFALSLLQLYGTKNKSELMRLVTTVVPAERIKDAGTDAYGFYFVIRTSGGASYNFTLYIC
jgi:hypothetical protein